MVLLAIAILGKLAMMKIEEHSRQMYHGELNQTTCNEEF